MPMAEEVKVQQKEGQLVIAGLRLAALEQGELWSAYRLGRGRVLLQLAASQERQQPLGAFARLPVECFADSLQGLHAQAWSGMVAVEGEGGGKRLFLRHGELVFARSDLVDDRLGEIIYRNGKLSLDELTDLAARVDSEHKFGQLLVASGLFDHRQLWQALQAQVYQIVCSLFMQEQVSFELFPDQRPSTEIHFAEGTGRFLESCFAFGGMYRSFASRLTSASSVFLSRAATSQQAYPQGTFLGDFLRLIAGSSNIYELIDAAKIQQAYAVTALMRLMNEGLCLMENLSPAPAPLGRQFLLPLKSKCHIYDYLLQEVRAVFRQEEKELPIAEMKAMALALNDDSFPVLFLDEREGTLHLESFHHMVSQCIAAKSRLAHFEAAMESLSRYLMHLAQEYLDSRQLEQLKDTYRKFVNK